MGKMLGGNKKDCEIEKFCAFCEFGTPVPGPDGEDTDVVCPKKGVVRATYVCRRFPNGKRCRLTIEILAWNREKASTER